MKRKIERKDHVVSEKQKEYLKKERNHLIRIHISRIVLLGVLLWLWETAANKEWIDDFIFSSPSRLVHCAIVMAEDGILWENISTTLFVTIVSFFVVTILSILTALLLWFSKTLSQVLEPYLVVLNSLPKSALAPLLIVWLGNNSTTILVAGASVAIFGAVLTLYTRFKETDEEKIKLICTLGGNRFDLLFRLILPGSIPAVISNMKVNIGLCLIGIIIGEMISGKRGLGYLIIYGSQVFKLDYVILSIIILCVIAMVFYFLLGLLNKQVQKHFAK